MLDYYNVQFAGSAIMFPEMNETFLMGQEVVVTVGWSKLFYVSTPPASPIYGRITSIHPDYPGFGLVLREDDLKSRLSEIGQSLGNPYKVTAYMKSGIATSTLKERYKNLHLNFDKDKIEQLQKKLHTITYAFLVIFFFIGGIIFTIIVFLLGGIFRESSSIYRMMNTFGITTIKWKILTLGEPIFLTLLGILGGWVVNSICMHFLTVYTSGFLTGKWIIFPFISISTIEIGIIIFFIFIILIGILLFLDKKARKKTI